MSAISMVEPEKLIEKVAAYLKEGRLVNPPPWAMYVKTSVSRERPPTNPNWWYIRAASLLRKLYIKGPMGVSRIRKFYGGKKRGRLHPPHSRKGSGSILRKELQQLEKAGFVTTVAKRGRALTPKGRKLLEETVKSLISRKSLRPD